MISSQSHRFPFRVGPRENDAYSGAHRKAVVKHERATVNQTRMIKPWGGL